MEGAIATEETEEIIPLRSWLRRLDANAKSPSPSSIDRNTTTTSSSSSSSSNKKNESIIRRITVAYGIAELMKHAENDASKSDDYAQIDNFVVYVANDNTTLQKNYRPPGEEIKGVGMLSPNMSLSIEEPSYLSFLDDDDQKSDDDGISDCQWGRCLEVHLMAPSSSVPSRKNNDITPQLTTEASDALQSSNNNLASLVEVAAAVAAEDEGSHRCYLFARLLFQLLLNEPFPNYDPTDLECVASSPDGTSLSAPTTGPVRKKARKKLMLIRARGDYDKEELTFQIPCVIRMQKLGIPASICLMMHNLLEFALRGNSNGGSVGSGSVSSGSVGEALDAYTSFVDVCEDLHLLLLDPTRFLFDTEGVNTNNSSSNNSSDMRLLYRKNKLYGRENEESLITDAFCRVSRGQSEAFFIGGFSGSGKSMLVNTLRKTVGAVGGYVIKHKFDANTQEGPLSGVISAFNQICQQMKRMHSPRRLNEIATKLGGEFGVDFGLLVRILPNVCVLTPAFASFAAAGEKGMNDGHPIQDNINIRSVSFTLLRFVRAVSSPRHPITLFLDDIQWADSTALDVIHTILSDTMGSCMFFVGTYRNNEVQIDHALFNLMEKLDISNVRTTKVTLAGLGRDDLNAMISDALCLYPRICKSLSNIVFQKTKGNPFFVLEFMQSLLFRGLLQYNFHQKRWMWNEDIIRTEEITNNVLHLLASKMNGSTDDVQTLLKVMACFGTSTEESVIGHLSESTEYPGLRDGLEGAVSDGFVEKDDEGRFKFVHDKVREAAYDLIPDKEKNQFHYNLGKVLLSICEGEDVGDTILLVASHINYGKEIIQEEDEEIAIALATLNMRAGKRAMDGCDHKAAYSYLQVALSLLPSDHWERHYDLSLRLHFLVAVAANSSCQYDSAQLILHNIFENARCLEDKSPSLLFLSQILIVQDKAIEAYNICSSALTELGESIPNPDSVEPDTIKTEIAKTINMYNQVCEDDNGWLKREVDDSKERIVDKFYGTIATASYFSKRLKMLAYFSCKGFQLSLRNGVCQHTPSNAIHFAHVAYSMMKDQNAVVVYRMAKNIMSLLDRVDVGDQIPTVYFSFYGTIAWRYEPIQLCTNFLRQGFESGLTCGKSEDGFYCAVQFIKFSIFGGENLMSLLKEIDYYLHQLETYNNALARNFMLNHRETVSTLIDKGSATAIEAKASFPSNHPGESAVIVHQAVRMYWLGWTLRCTHFIQKNWKMIEQSGPYLSCIINFYYALNCLDMAKRNKKAIKNRDSAEIAMAVIRCAAVNSEWNFAGKLHLLEAELSSFMYKPPKKFHETMAWYESAIAHAKNSGFIHEHGLACEKAGLYVKKAGDMQKAMEYFNQAKESYSEWGSSLKVDFIQNEMNKCHI